MLLDADRPQTLHTLGLGMVVALVRVVRVDLGDAQSEQGQGKFLEGVLGGDAVVDFGEYGVFGAGFLVRGGHEGANRTLDCAHVSTNCS